MPDNSPAPITVKPKPDSDETTLLVIDALALIRQWKFLADNTGVLLTPRQADDVQNEREQWLERAGRWSKNKPEYKVPDA